MVYLSLRYISAVKVIAAIYMFHARKEETGREGEGRVVMRDQHAACPVHNKHELNMNFINLVHLNTHFGIVYLGRCNPRLVNSVSVKFLPEHQF